MKLKSLFIGAVSTFLPLSAFAQVATGDAAQGYMYVRESCAQCHIVADNQPPPVVLSVPSFFSIANDPATTVASLRAWLRTPHDRMPNLIIGRGDVDNIIAYILSLRGREHRRPGPQTPVKPEKGPKGADPAGF